MNVTTDLIGQSVTFEANGSWEGHIRAVSMTQMGDFVAVIQLKNGTLVTRRLHGMSVA